MLTEGTQAPDFTIPGSDGEEISQYTLTESLADGPVIILFYPFDFSPVCTDQLCAFRDAEFLTLTEGLDVWGISPDSAYSHKQFITEYDLQFPLLSDRLGDVADQYGCRLKEFQNHANIPHRSVVAIDSAQTIRYTWMPDGQFTSPSIDVIEASYDWYRDNLD